MLGYFLNYYNKYHKQNISFFQSQKKHEDDDTELEEQVIAVKLNYRYSIGQSILSAPYVKNNFTYQCTRRMWDNSVGKGSCWQTWQPESDPWKTCMVGGHQLPQGILWPPYMWYAMCACTHVHSYTFKWINTYNKNLKLLPVSFL